MGGRLTKAFYFFYGVVSWFISSSNHFSVDYFFAKYAKTNRFILVKFKELSAEFSWLVKSFPPNTPCDARNALVIQVLFAVVIR